MAIIDFLKKQFIDIIEWTDDSRDTLSFRFPDEDKEIKNGAQLIVRESQVAQFVYLGEFGDTFGPGKHTLTTDNIPVLTNLKSWKYALESPFKADVYYVVTRVFTGNKWGTANPVMMRDADFGVVRLRAYGTYDFRVVDPKKFLKEVAGTDDHFRLDEFADTMRSRHRQRVLRRAGRGQDPGARRCVALRGARRGAAAAHQSGDRREVRPRDDDVHRRERLGAARGRAGDRQALEHGRRRQPQRLREIPDGAGAGERRRRPRRHGGRNGGRHGDGAADAAANGRADGAVDAGRRGRAAARRRPDALHARAGRADARRGRSRCRREPRLPAISRARRSARNGASRAPRSTRSWAHERGQLRGRTSHRHAGDARTPVRASCQERCGRARLGRVARPARDALGLALAQDPRATPVQKAARDWLALTDKLDAAGTWKAAGSRFQDAITEARWAALLRRERESRGALLQRTAAATTFGSQLPGLPAGGNYALVRFRTSFANQPNSGEDVTLEQGPDSVWRVIGYVIR